MKNQDKVYPVTLNILGKIYKVACTNEEQGALIQSAKQLDQQMREIRDSGTINGIDRIAVMAALNLTHDLRQLQDQNNDPQHDVADQLTSLRNKIEKVLENN